MLRVGHLHDTHVLAAKVHVLLHPVPLREAHPHLEELHAHVLEGGEPIPSRHGQGRKELPDDPSHAGEPAGVAPRPAPLEERLVQLQAGEARVPAGNPRRRGDDAPAGPVRDVLLEAPPGPALRVEGVHAEGQVRVVRGRPAGEFRLGHAWEPLQVANHHSTFSERASHARLRREVRQNGKLLLLEGLRWKHHEGSTFSFAEEVAVWMGANSHALSTNASISRSIRSFRFASRLVITSRGRGSSSAAAWGVCVRI
eukprot:scaffold2601_cov198-Pinguiococcus_pyrenoidosus.AAC.3